VTVSAPPTDPPAAPVIPLRSKDGSRSDPAEAPVIPLRSKRRSKSRRADRTEREQDLLDLLKEMKRENRCTADAIFIAVEHIAKSPGNTVAQAVCRVVDFANKNRVR
jgi:hypothetical protein